MAEDLSQTNPSLKVEFRSMVEADWLAYLALKKRDLGGRAL